MSDALGSQHRRGSAHNTAKSRQAWLSVDLTRQRGLVWLVFNLVGFKPKSGWFAIYGFQSVFANAVLKVFYLEFFSIVVWSFVGGFHMQENVKG